MFNLSLMQLIKQSYMAIIAMAIIVYSSNILVQYPIGDYLTYGAFTYPLSFLVLDIINRMHGLKAARLVVLCGFILGVALSLSGDVRIAIASGTAYLVTQMLDVSIFDKLRNKDWWRAPLISSFLAALLDTMLFWTIAFYNTDVPWVELAIGDGLVKFAIIILSLIPYRIFITFNK